MTTYYSGSFKTKAHQGVAMYLQVMEMLTIADDGEERQWFGTAKDPDARNEAERQMGLLRAYMKQARVFHVDPHDFADIYRSIDVYTTEVLCKMTHHGEGSDPGMVDDEERLEHFRIIMEAGRKVPFPDRLPFDCCFFTTGGRTGWTPTQLSYRVDPDLIEDSKVVQSGFAGWLVTHAGVVVEFTWILTADDVWAVIPMYARQHGEWTFPYNLQPWLVNAVVWMVNEHKSTILEGHKPRKHEKAEFRSINRKLNLFLVPKQYYTIKLRDTVLQEYMRRLPTGEGHMVQSYRYDVRSHDRIRVRRGPKPICPVLKKRLLSPNRNGNSYRLFESGRVADDLWADLVRRGIHGRADGEWIAVLKSEIAQHMRGPEDAPYIPAVREVEAPDHMDL